VSAGLPANVDAERFVLGSILLDDTWYVIAAGALEADDFSLEKHRRIFRRMGDLQSRGERIDRVTVANELMKCDQLESCDGLGYLVSLDDGLPRIPNIDSYIRIVLDKSTLRRIYFAAEHLQNRCLAGDEIPAEILAGANSTILALAEGCSETTFLTASQIITREGGFQKYLDRKTRARGLASGYPMLDTLTGGFEGGRLYVIGARPRMGKTALALNIAERVSVDHDKRTAIFSLEMSDVSLLDRLICSRARVNLRRFTGGWLNEEERKAIGRAAGEIAADDRILIDQRANTTMEDIHAKIRKEKARGGLHLVILDYLQLLLQGKDEFRVSEMSRISRNVKVIAKDCDVPFIALSQLSRAVDARQDHRPVLSDLRESGAVEQDADLVGFIFREDVYRRPDDPKDGFAELIVAKQRDGPEGIIPMSFFGEIVRFEERAMSSEPQG
jgi:replicative DNA helicase